MAVKNIFLTIALLLIFSVVLGKRCRKVKQQCSCPPLPQVVPFYRYWNGVEHFYTSNVDEIGATVAGEKGRHGYTCEGIAFYAQSTIAPQAQHTLACEAQTAVEPQAQPVLKSQAPEGNF